MGQYWDEKERKERGEIDWDDVGPELLAALEKARESLLGMQEMLHTCGAAYGLGLTWQMIDAAIAKAEGRP